MKDKEQIISLGERHSLAMPIELEEGVPPFFFRATLGILSGLFFLLLVWANIAQVREISFAIGEFAPSDPVRNVAHLEGGIVDSISVKAGDIVEEGAELLRLSGESGDGTFAQYTARRAELRIRALRLQSQAEGKEPDFSAYEADWPELVAEHKGTYLSSYAEHELALQTFAARKTAAEVESKGARTVLTQQKELLALAEEQLKIQEKLMEGEFTSRQALLEARSAVASAKEGRANAQTRYNQSVSSLKEARSEMDRFVAEYRARASEERSKVIAELAELKSPFLVSEDREDRLVIRSPISGVVNELIVKGRGDVVRPGEVVAEVVPVGKKLVAEVRIQPKDIGHVAPGQEAEVTVTTFDIKKYGMLKGFISQVSADNFIDEMTGETYYKATIELDDALNAGNKVVELISTGMEVNVKVITNERTLMTYILKPVVRSLDSAFSER